MRFLILSFYYQPDLSAGSFRTTALIKALLQELPDDAHIDLITTLPNRYSSFSSDAPQREEFSRLTVHRLALSAHKSGMIDQSKAFISYAKGVMDLVKGKKYDLVYGTSSRLMTAALAKYVAWRAKAPLYLDIRDIFVDTIKDVLPGKSRMVIKPIVTLLERWTLRSAGKVNLVSGGFLPYFEQRYPNNSYSLFTNGIDDEFIEAGAQESDRSYGSLTVLYAGNIGEGQGLHLIIPQLAAHYGGRLRFQIIGDGGRRQQLTDALAAKGCHNVEILPPVKRNELIAAYQAADILFLHLNDYEAFKKVLPSKVFEYSALGKPIWAGVAGYAAEFIKSHVSNAAVFEPCNVGQAIESFETIQLDITPRAEFIEQFARRNIMQSMAKDVVLASAERC
ncbi:glycosyltransferase family 4 protein [Pseudomonas sp. gcc21]|uniref:glycosyltransferase family 4 protein n=1 Tax=Pseudomonas sp. gcc21 TaxID=2726989 RepID=UPI001451C1FF|nr:glycosyltransferase family 4 protein [Pseudomonas sp. gcc21]QJD58668.1 glycosyltransferase family 4 protein [Pseudomonas sp. gcc21]